MPSKRPDWMHRGHPDYDPNDIGALTESKVETALVEAGHSFCCPSGLAVTTWGSMKVIAWRGCSARRGRL
jgi:hypothetical protein